MVIEKNNKKYNKSTVFLLPMLGLPLQHFKNFYNVYYKTIYDKDTDIKRIYVVYKNEDLTSDITINISRATTFMDKYYIDNFTIFRYRVPELFLKDFILFCNGKYNTFSTKYKNILTGSYIMNKVELERILNALPKDRQALADKFDVNIEDIKEIYPIPDEIGETFTIANNYNLEI